MPDTLGVTADESATSPGLIAGFAETQERLFEDDPPPIRTLDQVGEETNAEAYRDLLHEIDRAFEGYERIAVSHGWLADRGMNADTAQVAAADAAQRHGDAVVGHIDLLNFTAAAVEAETGWKAGRSTVLRVPVGWVNDLVGLPGFDEQQQLIRLTRQRTRTRDADGHPVGFLGRAHPMVRRAIACTRRNRGIDNRHAFDTRVSAARMEAGVTLSLLLTYSLELHSARCIEVQRVIAVLLPASGLPVEVQQPSEWLRLGGTRCSVPAVGLWRDLFACWAPMRQREADAVAAATMDGVAAELTASRRKSAETEAVVHERWLRLRANDICGASIAATADLFGAEPNEPTWQSSSVPLDRLAAYAADASNPAARRREASSAVELFLRRINERGEILRPMLHPIGMLMLVPDGCVP